jgi:hypothetical protein
MVLQMLKRNLSLVSTFCLVTLMFAAPAKAAMDSAGGGFGLGIQIGDPSAITVKDSISDNHAIDGGIAFNLSQWTLLYSDYLFQMPGVFGNQNAFVARTTPYVGFGAMVVISNEDTYDTQNLRYFNSSSSTKIAVAARVPIGAEWRAERAPIGVYLEIDPGLVIVPATFGFVQGALGARFYF